MYNFLKRCFSNNSVARGLLYAGVSILTMLSTSFATWTNDPPKNGYAICAVIFGALSTAGLTIRAYIDQHLSQHKKDGTEVAK